MPGTAGRAAGSGPPGIRRCADAGERTGERADRFLVGAAREVEEVLAHCLGARELEEGQA